MKPIFSVLLLLLPLLLHAAGSPEPPSFIGTQSDEPVTVSDRPLRPVFAAYTLGVGSAHLADTYLTPLRYSGSHFDLDYLRYQAAPFCSERLSMRLGANLSVDHTTNPAGNATMWSALLTLDWGVIHRFKAPIAALPALTLGAGASINLQAGCLYNTRNGNNPASARGAATLCVTGYAAYPLRIGRLPVTLMYQPSVPLTGVFFSPDYGELYYEIYLGNHSGLVHGAWPGNYRRLDQLITADLHLGNTSIRLGYRGGYFSSRVSGITSRHFNHSLVIGLSGEWLSYSPRRRHSSIAPIISPIL